MIELTLHLIDKIIKDKYKTFNNKYDLTEIEPDFYNDVLVVLDSKYASPETHKSTWRMLFSKLYIEPLVIQLIGKDKCKQSTIQQDRNEKWDIEYNYKYYYDVKSTYKNSTGNFGFNVKDYNYLMSRNFEDNKYFIFIYPEIKTYSQIAYLQNNIDLVNLYAISYNDLKQVFLTNTFVEKCNVKIIPIEYMNKNDKFRKLR